MTDDSVARKWNARYGNSLAPVPPPAEVLSQGERWLPVFEDTGLSEGNSLRHNDVLLALDLACGRAGNGHWLAERGFTVSAWDISDVAINDLKARKPQLLHDMQTRDVVAMPPDPNSFDVIVVARFLVRSLCPALAAALKSGGILYYQTFTHGLSNADFLLESNELLSLFAGLKILEYHESEPDEQGRAEARLVACKP